MLQSKKSDVIFYIILGVGIVFILGIAVVFVERAIEGARVKNFWDDETFGLSLATSMTYGQHFFLGTKQQGSPNPLDYMFLKFLDSMYKPVFSNVPYNIYYRLNSMFWTLMAGLCVAFVFLVTFYRQKNNKGILTAQIVLIGIGLASFYFLKDNMHFAIETRPYALWNSLWFVMLCLVMLRASSICLFLLGLLLAFTNLGALVQISVLALCRFVFRIIDTGKWGKSFVEMIAVFLVPFLIAFYYALHVGSWTGVRSIEEYEMYTVGFLLFWVSQWPVPIVSLVGIFLTVWDSQWRGCTVVFVTMLILYCISPLINFHILLHRFFFVPRQYLYYDLVYPLFCLAFGLILPSYWKMIFKDQRALKIKCSQTELLQFFIRFAEAGRFEPNTSIRTVADKILPGQKYEQSIKDAQEYLRRKEALDEL